MWLKGLRAVARGLKIDFKKHKTKGSVRNG